MQFMTLINLAKAASHFLRANKLVGAEIVMHVTYRELESAYSGEDALNILPYAESFDVMEGFHLHDIEILPCAGANYRHRFSLKYCNGCVPLRDIGLKSLPDDDDDE